jgi:hypothetical protein
MNQADVERARKLARHFHRIGLTPIPSRMDEKAPLVRRGAVRSIFDGEPYDGSLLDTWRTTNMQVVTGTKHPGKMNLCVVDLDGPASIEVWSEMRSEHNFAPSSAWIVESGSGGQHWWFRLPDGITEFQTRRIWGLWDTRLNGGKGNWSKHCEVKLIGDRSLIIAPPSFHVKTGKQYRFLDSWNPVVHRLPEVAPDWLIGYPEVRVEQQLGPKVSAPAPLPPRARTGYRPRSDEPITYVLNRVPTEAKVQLLRESGLRFAEPIQLTDDWMACHAYDRQDSSPSASFCPRKSIYHDHSTGQTVKLLDLLVCLGAFMSTSEASDYIRSVADR